MDKKEMLTITSAIIAGAASAISIVFAYEKHKTIMNDHERIEQLEDTVKWMVKSDFDLQKESDQSKN